MPNDYWTSVYYDNFEDYYRNIHGSCSYFCNQEYLCCSAWYQQPYYITTSHSSINWTRLYYQVFSLHYDYRIPYERMKRAIYRLNQAYNPDCRSALRDVDYRVSDNRLAYLYLFASCHSALIEKLMDDYFNHFVVSLTLTKSIINICSLGGGPGCDVLGLQEAIYKKFLGVQIQSVVIDKYAQWHELVGHFSDLCRDSTWDHTFFEVADLLEHCDRDRCRDLIYNADIVCLVKFISVIMYENQEKCEKFIQFVLEEMNPGALLLFVDCAGGGSFQVVNKLLACHRSFTCRYLRKGVKFSFQENPRLPQVTRSYSVLRSCKVTIAIWAKV